MNLKYVANLRMYLFAHTIVDFMCTIHYANFSSQAPTFHIEEFFTNMGWVSVVSMEENAYSRLIKEFYGYMVVNPRLNSISCLLNHAWINFIKNLIQNILKFPECENEVFHHKFHLTFKRYNPILARPQITSKNFENPTKFSANQLILP